MISEPGSNPEDLEDLNDGLLELRAKLDNAWNAINEWQTDGAARLQELKQACDEAWAGQRPQVIEHLQYSLPIIAVAMKRLLRHVAAARRELEAGRVGLDPRSRDRDIAAEDWLRRQLKSLGDGESHATGMAP